MRNRAGWARWLLCVGSVLTLYGCELQEIVVSVPEDLVVAEVYVQNGTFGPRGIAYLHRTGGGASPRVPGADISLVTQGGDRFRFLPFALDGCVLGTIPIELEGSCYLLEPPGRTHVRPGAFLRVEIELPGGGRLTGETTVPGDFEIVQPGPSERPVCALAPETRLSVEWTPSDRTWAYVAETELFGLKKLLAPVGIEVKEDPVVLLGLAISREDTTIVFPSEFGVFDRADRDRDLLVLLQDGLPLGATASIVISAGDRNYVNWVRGGGFNPSGQVRLPSLAGSGGTGVFGSQIVRRILLETDEDPGQGSPACSGALPPRSGVSPPT